jgi:hypothetical protein
VLVVFPTFLLNMSTNRFVAGGDSWPVLPTLFSLFTHGNLELSEQAHLAPSGYIDPETGLPYCILARGGRLYSSYPAGMMIFAAPVCAGAKLCGADFGSTLVRDRLERLAAAGVGALCIGLFFLIATRLQDAKAAALMTLILATGSTMTSTVGHALWQHGGVVFWSLLALLLEMHWSVQSSHTDQRGSAKISLLQGVCLGMMLSCRPTAGIILAVVVGWIGLRNVKRGVLVVAGVLIGYLPWAIFYEIVYGAFLGPTQAQAHGRNWGFSAVSLTGVLVSPTHGVLVYQPWLLLIAFTAFVRYHRRDDSPGGWMPACAAAVAMQILLIANWKCWWGGACWGSRLLADVIPLAALLCLPAVGFLLKRRWGVATLALVAVVSAFLHLAVLHMNASWAPQPNQMDSAQAPFVHLFAANR